MQDVRQGGSGARRGVDWLAVALVFALASHGLLDLLIASGVDGLRDLQEPDRHHVEPVFEILRSLAGLALLFPAVLWLVWSRRAVVRANARAGAQFAGSPARAVWSWFAPILNLWMPCVVALRVWRVHAGTERFLVGKLVLGAWWLTWIAGQTLLVWTDAVWPLPEDTTRRASWIAAQASGRILLALSALLAIVVVLRVARGERA